MAEQVTDIGQEKKSGKLRVVLDTGYKGFTLRPREGMALFRAILHDPLEHLTDDFILTMTELLEEGNFPETAAASLGIPKSMWDKWMTAGQQLMQLTQDDPQSINMMSDDEEKLMCLAIATTQALAHYEQKQVARIEQASRYDWAAGAWLLAKRFPERWGKGRDQAATQINVGVNTNVNTGVLAVSPPEQQEKWLETFQEVKLLPEGERQNADVINQQLSEVQ